MHTFYTHEYTHEGMNTTVNLHSLLSTLVMKHCDISAMSTSS